MQCSLAFPLFAFHHPSLSAAVTPFTFCIFLLCFLPLGFPLVSHALFIFIAIKCTLITSILNTCLPYFASVPQQRRMTSLTQTNSWRAIRRNSPFWIANALTHSLYERYGKGCTHHNNTQLMTPPTHPPLLTLFQSQTCFFEGKTNLWTIQTKMFLLRLSHKLV